jgi:hypothetical protein
MPGNLANANHFPASFPDGQLAFGEYGVGGDHHGLVSHRVSPISSG